MTVIIDRTSYWWDRASNIKYEGRAGGKIKYIAGGLGVAIKIDLYEIGDSSNRLIVDGTIRCPPR